MRAVNLLPKEFAARKSLREEDPAVVVGSALAVVVIIALGAAFLVAQGKASGQQKRLTAARLELAKLSLRHRTTTTQPKKPAVPVTPILPPPAIVGQEAAWLTAVSSALSQRIAWDRVLREVSLVMPDDVTLTSLTMTAPTTAGAIPGAPPAVATAQGFVIDGSAYSYPSVARLLTRLALVPDLSNVTLTSTSSDPKTGVTFSITAAVKGAVAPAAAVPTTPAVTDTTATTTTSAGA
jgi:Tfp pilus assembly protein PilN